MDEGQKADTLTTNPGHGGGVVTLAGKLFSIPSPAETAMLLRRSGAEYRPALMFDPAKADVIATRMGRSLALGVVGADLAYATMNQDPARAAGAIKAISDLGERSGMGNAFPKDLLDRCRKNLDHQDSLLRLSGEAFREADRYMKTNESDDLSALVLAGGWIESLHLSAEFAQADPKGELALRVGAQKTTLTNLISLLEATDEQKTCAELCADLRTLQSTYADVRLDYAYEDPVTDAEKHVTYINSNTQVSITAEQIKAIAGQVAALRNKYLI